MTIVVFLLVGWSFFFSSGQNCVSGPSGDCVSLKKVKTEPPDGEIIQVTVPGTSAVSSYWM